MRRRPYTARGLRRVPCVVCGEPSSEQFCAMMCADNNRQRWVALCQLHDYRLNELVLDYLNVPGTKESMAEYGKRLDPAVRATL